MDDARAKLLENLREKEERCNRVGYFASFIVCPRCQEFQTQAVQYDRNIPELILLGAVGRGRVWVSGLDVCTYCKDSSNFRFTGPVLYGRNLDREDLVWAQELLSAGEIWKLTNDT